MHQLQGPAAQAFRAGDIPQIHSESRLDNKKIGQEDRNSNLLCHGHTFCGNSLGLGQLTSGRVHAGERPEPFYDPDTVADLVEQCQGILEGCHSLSPIALVPQDGPQPINRPCDTSSVIQLLCQGQTTFEESGSGGEIDAIRSTETNAARCLKSEQA